MSGRCRPYGRSTRRTLTPSIRRLVGDPDLAADIAQEVWIQIFRALPSYRGESQFGTWAHRIAVNRTLNALRRTRRIAKSEADMEDDTVAVEHDSERALLAASIEEAANRLSPGARTVFMMHDVEGYTHEEIARRARHHAGRLEIPAVQGAREASPPARARGRWTNTGHGSRECRTCLLSASPSLPTANPPSRKRSTSPRARSAPTERSAHRRLLSMALDERDRVAAPLTQWSTLAAKLREQRIIADDYARARHRRDERRPHRAATAAPACVARWTPRCGGTRVRCRLGALGRMSAGASAAPSGKEVATLGEPDLPRLGRTGHAVRVRRSELAVHVRRGRARDARDSQRNYDRAVAFIAAHDSTGPSPEAGDVFRTRLAALDEMAETSRQALSVAPADPVLNQYYLSTLGAREVTLRQLGSVLTPGNRLTRF